MKLALPCPVLRPDAVQQAARRLGVSPAEVTAIALGERALVAGEVLDEVQFWKRYPDADFDDATGSRAIPAELSVRAIDVPRDPGERMSPPITGADVAAAEIHAIARRLASLERLGAPGILLGNERRRLQAACLAHGEPTWQPLAELVTGAPPPRGAVGAPDPMFAESFDAPGGVDAATPLDAAFLPDGFLVSCQYASVVLGADGGVRDVFPTCGLRLVGADRDALLLVCGGGPTGSSGYIGGEALVRVVAERRWHTGAVPATLPGHVAGTIGDVKWAVVLDVAAPRGYRMSPGFPGDQCGEAFNSACGRYAWDAYQFVREAATGEAVLDARDVRGRLVGFARAADGWRFLVGADKRAADGAAPALRILDERGTELRRFEDTTGAWALSPDGTRVLHVTREALVVIELDASTPPRPVFALAPLLAALALPEDTELWRQLAAHHAVPAEVATFTVEAVRAALPRRGDEAPTDAEIAEAIAVAATLPPLPRAVARAG